MGEAVENELQTGRGWVEAATVGHRGKRALREWRTLKPEPLITINRRSEGKAENGRLSTSPLKLQSSASSPVSVDRLRAMSSCAEADTGKRKHASKVNGRLFESHAERGAVVPVEKKQNKQKKQTFPRRRPHESARLSAVSAGMCAGDTI